jgi:hypothetical protein
MQNTIKCDKCHAMTTVVKYVSDPDELAAIGRARGLDQPVKPYYVVDCPNCGKKVVETDSQQGP